MKPIPFCSFRGDFRPTNIYWWKDLIRYLGKGWWRDVRTAWHRARYGWAPRDVWSLDHYLNRVLGHSLQHLSKTTHGAPIGYPLGAKAPTDKFGMPATDHDQWEADLQRWGQVFLDLHAWTNGADLQTEDVKARIKEEHRLYQQVRKTLREMAPWWGGLWN